MKPKNNKVRKRLRSFYYAAKGIRLAAGQPNFRLQLVAALVVVVLGFWLNVTLIEWSLLVLCIGSVLTAEVLNTSIEVLTDSIYPNHDHRAERIKDLAAGAVLAVAIAAVMVGLLILGPKLIDHF